MMFALLLLLVSLQIASSVVISKREASTFLGKKKRIRRENSSWHHAEEMEAGDLERECIEETCSYGEFSEIFENQRLSAPLWSSFSTCRESFPESI